MEAKLDDKDAINKTQTADRERDRDREFGTDGNVREKGQDPSPGDRARGERSDAEPEQSGGAGGTKRR